ncbi:MAG: OmpA family protein, partial [Mesorhizobium sp.]
MLTRRTFATALVAALAMPTLAAAQATTPSAAT